MNKNSKKNALRYLGIAVFALLFHSTDCFGQKDLPLDNSTCNPQDTLNCLWNDKNGCFIRASRSLLNGTCAPVDDSGRAGVQVLSSDGTQVFTTRCVKTVTVNALCDTIITPTPPFQSVTTTINSGGSNGDPCLGGGGGVTDFTGGGGGNIGPACSPIIVDTTGEGFHLTSAEDGVLFDIRGTGQPIRIAWTDPAYRNGFLALDRNRNGVIDNGTELFGNFTQQPKSPTPNGFLALAEFDKPENGGNSDGVIDEQDAVFSHLVIWVDENHDGVSQPSELHSLPELGIFSIALNYKESRRTDEFGNIFRFKAKINSSGQDKSNDPGSWSYDVFLVTK